MNAASNPYQTPSESEPEARSHWFPRLLLVLVSFILLIRGLLMTLAYIPLGFQSGSFFLGIYLKDGIYAATALLGSTLLFFRSRPGWFLALAHWCWYIAFEVVVAGCAFLFAWTFPLSLGIASTAIASALAAFALIVILSKPVMSSCGVSSPRFKILGAVLSFSIVAAFLVNGLALSRWW
ncbi:MAG: hypothetical protein AAGG48_01290 [Planctomycetota bacterium]